MINKLRELYNQLLANLLLRNEYLETYNTVRDGNSRVVMILTLREDMEVKYRLISKYSVFYIYRSYVANDGDTDLNESCFAKGCNDLLTNLLAMQRYDFRENKSHDHYKFYGLMRVGPAYKDIDLIKFIKTEIDNG